MSSTRRSENMIFLNTDKYLKKRKGMGKFELIVQAGARAKEIKELMENSPEIKPESAKHKPTTVALMELLNEQLNIEKDDDTTKE